MDELSALLHKSHCGDKEARQSLIENNMGLVFHVVKRFAGKGYEYEDLCQIGTIGLIKAVDRFDISQGVCFSTYAVPMIMGEIKRFLRDDGPIKISRSIKDNCIKIDEAVKNLGMKLGREPLVSEISEYTSLTREEIVEATESKRELSSIYESYENDTSTQGLIEKVVLLDEGNHGVGALCSGYEYRDFEKEKVVDRMLLKQLLCCLEPDECNIIQMRYFQEKTQSDVAKSLGITQVQVCRLEKKILLKMRSIALS